MDKTNYVSTLKSEDTEEWLDLQFTRPIGYYLAYAYQRIKVTPNGVTLISIILGIGAGICFYSSQLEINFIGMLLLILANLHDSADGQLARLTGKSTRIGRILDGVAGDLWFITIYISLCLRLSPMDPTIWFVAIIAGISHVIQAAMADYHRNIHLLFVYGRSRSEIECSADIERRIKELSFKHAPLSIIALYFYKNYTKLQEFFSPQLQKLIKQIKLEYGETIPQQLSTLFRIKNKHLMKYTNILTFNTRMIILFIALLIEQPELYFYSEITIFNLLLIYMIYKQEQISKFFCKRVTYNA